MKFWKYQALGNDFILVHHDAPGWPGAERAQGLAAQLCDRHFGIGGDGVLVVEPSERAVARMVILNADGSRPEMCGNGIRCFVLHLAEQLGRAEGEFTVETDAGVLRCALRSGASGAPEIAVSMGRARLDAEGAHVAAERWPKAPLEPLALPDTPWRLIPASMGNPHAVIRVDDPGADLNALARTEGPALSAHPAFTEGVNVEWTRVTDAGGLEVAVHERGVGPTLACGTGACAAAAVAHRLGWVDASAPLPVALPGGTLRIAVGASEDPARTGEVTMIGPAALVFAGETPGGWDE